ncbi:MAG: hypothetical protein J7623_29610 [Chitinophaga sp.]|uniref:hypothetical protein n=1 Tax=Chitinophaga sp. TaxID=1869181 RepID=UPI001B26574B|nr:hypothetical protein [Chitinophaga sp.]MBO9732837.1 hypothetical protein [Chitinophaga sp.]
MRIILNLIIVLLITACQSSKGPSRNTTLKLKDNRGTIRMNLPTAWDTSFQWIHYGDCGLPCNKIKYRFQSKAFPVALENGWFYEDFQKDSVEQLTVIQEALKQTTTDTLVALRSFRSNVKKSFLIENAHAQFVLDTIQQVGRHLIAVVGVAQKSHDGSLQYYDIDALAILKRDGVLFEFKFLSKKGQSGESLFVKKVMDIIHSIQLEE